MQSKIMNIAAASRSSENATQFKYFRIVKYENLIQDKIKKRLNPGNVCYHSKTLCLLICCLESKELEYIKQRFAEEETLAFSRTAK
jgi:hypothetical protein